MAGWELTVPLCHDIINTFLYLEEQDSYSLCLSLIVDLNVVELPTCKG
jgi:hypothetical protein